MSSSVVFIIPVFLIFVAQVSLLTSSKLVDATPLNTDERDKVIPFQAKIHRNVPLNVALINKRDTQEQLKGDIVTTGRKSTKYSYYYLGRSVLYFVLYYQLFYNFYFLAHIVRSAFLHRVSQPPGHLQYYRDKVLPPLLGNLVYERWPLHNYKEHGRKRGFFDNEQLEPSYEINQEGIHNLTMTVLNAIKKFSGDYNSGS